MVSQDPRLLIPHEAEQVQQSHGKPRNAGNSPFEAPGFLSSPSRLHQCGPSWPCIVKPETARRERLSGSAEQICARIGHDGIRCTGNGLCEGCSWNESILSDVKASLTALLGMSAILMTRWWQRLRLEPGMSVSSGHHALGSVISRSRRNAATRLAISLSFTS